MTNSKESLDKMLLSGMFDKQFEQLHTETLQLDNQLESIDTKCYSRKNIIDHSSFTQLAGYENLNTNTFYLQPEKKNTYHNYPVLQDNGQFCSMNHQIFRNNTKRNNIFIEHVPHKNIDHIIPGDVPIFHENNICKLK